MNKDIPSIDLDQTDRALLRHLQDDGSLSSTALGGMPVDDHAPCWRHRKRLKTNALSSTTRPDVLSCHKETGQPTTR